MSINKAHLPISKWNYCIRETKWELVTIYLIFLTSSPSSTCSSIKCLFLMESLKAIPFLYQAKAKLILLTFDSYISLHTAIFFDYTLWPVSHTIISDVMTWCWCSSCFALSTVWSFFNTSSLLWPSTWCWFIYKHQWLGKSNGELTKLQDIPFLNAKLLKLSPIKDPSIHFADINEMPKDVDVPVFCLCWYSV